LTDVTCMINNKYSISTAENTRKRNVYERKICNKSNKNGTTSWNYYGVIGTLIEN